MPNDQVGEHVGALAAFAAANYKGVSAFAAAILGGLGWWWTSGYTRGRRDKMLDDRFNIVRNDVSAVTARVDHIENNCIARQKSADETNARLSETLRDLWSAMAANTRAVERLTGVVEEHTRKG